MKTKLAIIGLIIATIFFAPLTSTFARGDDFDAVVRAIEQFYHVKHQSLPLLARAGMKGARTVARVRGGDYKRIADAGSVRLVFFEDQEFNSQAMLMKDPNEMGKTLTDDAALNNNQEPIP